MNKQRVCKDCGTKDIILKVIPKNNSVYNIAVDLCSPCLQSRAQLQTMREDKMPFTKLLAKIQKETAKEVHNSIKYDSNRLDRYTGKQRYTTLATYWIEQLT